MPYIIAVLSMLCASAAAPADDQAAQPWYQVEVVVFQHDDSADTETWPDDPGTPDVAHAATLLPPLGPAAAPPAPGTAADAPAAAAVPPPAAAGAAPPSAATAAAPAAAADSAAFHLLPDGDLQLGDAVDKLDRTPGYRVLFHAAWRQPVSDPDHTRPVHVAVDPAGEDPMDGDAAPAAGTAPAAADAAAPAEASAPPVMPAPPAPAKPAWLLDGTIALAQSRYLHLDVDMLFEQRAAAPAAGDGGAAQTPAAGDGGAAGTAGAVPLDSDLLQGFRMQQSRRITSGKLYYFDHPRFGVLAQVSPYQPPPAADAAAPQPAAH